MSVYQELLYANYEYWLLQDYEEVTWIADTVREKIPTFTLDKWKVKSAPLINHTFNTFLRLKKIKSFDK